jgi:DNA repair protein RAD5
MSVQKREKVISAFGEDKSVTALILSIKASSTGLNLTMANNVLIVDPWWNVNCCDL